MTTWGEMTAADLGRGIGAGKIDPVELAQFFLDAIAASPVADRIYARLTPERALSEAAAARERAHSGRRLSPLDGVPISWKDLFGSAGVATEAGSALLAGRVPEKDAEVLRVATAMGLVCLGKTHLSELAFSGLGLNPVTATSPCINDPDAVAGGSSSGAAASVAFGLAAAAIGSDTGGSVRIPSVWNDLVGLKTTSGRVDCTGSVALAARFDTIGPLCRTVEDAALVLAALEGRPAPDMRGTHSLKGRRFAVMQTLVMDDLRDAPKAAYASALNKLSDAGAELVDFEFPEIEGSMADAGLLYMTEAWGTWRDAIEANPEAMFQPIRERFEGGRDFSGADFVAGWQRLDQVRAQWLERTSGFDAVLCPTAPILPPNVERLMTDSDYYVTENLLALRNTRVGNLMGVCAVTLPTGVPSCGISLMGAPMTEDRLLRIAAAAEAALAV
ncbi:amidase [Thalassococcus lentus]|uniref:Amidase family protein n=1 Tax=Thalassococcus lentus TaxID=1210524 RepID=A0ABT4XT82_9RHOB|nr:amidase family protein [Thalassococcus lentus]MDA7425146.1 amidase family protein [Thalassococcus lentus]